MQTSGIVRLSGLATRLALGLSTALSMVLVGCVSQTTYDKQVNETADLRQAFAGLQTEVANLAKQVAALQASRDELKKETEEARAAIQVEQETGPTIRQHALDKLAALQTQVAHLVNQGRALGREMADAKQQNTALKASAAQFKRELDDLRRMARAETPAQPITAAANPAQSANQAMGTPPGQPAQPEQVAQTTPPAPPKPPAARPQPETPPVDDSWTGMVIGWLSSLWNWMFQ